MLAAVPPPAASVSPVALVSCTALPLIRWPGAAVLDIALALTDGVLYVVGLTLLAAGIIGVVPALKATGAPVHTRLQGCRPDSGARMQMGRLWTALIVAQVALTVALLPATMFHAWTALRFAAAMRHSSGEVLTAQLALDRPARPGRHERRRTHIHGRLLARQQELERRLEGEGAVRDVTFSLTGPATSARRSRGRGPPAPSDLVGYNIVQGTKRGHLVRFNRVAFDFFDAFNVPVTWAAGSSVRYGVEAAAHPGVIVNRALVDSLFGGANPLGPRHALCRPQPRSERA